MDTNTSNKLNPTKFKEIAIEGVVHALDNLVKAERLMIEETTPNTPCPKYRVFEWIPKLISWPAMHNAFPRKSAVLGTSYVINISSDKTLGIGNPHEQKLFAEIIFDLCSRQPSKIVKVIRNIEASTAWCYKRKQGRERMTEAIFKQQKKYYNELEAQLVLKVMTE